MSDDCISRQAAIEAVIDLCKYYTPTKSVNHPHMDFVIEALQDLPPVNQEPKTGHWIYKQYGGYPECGDYHCSQCDEIDNRTPAYCPHCGCCMFEPKERSDKE